MKPPYYICFLWLIAGVFMSCKSHVDEPQPKSNKWLFEDITLEVTRISVDRYPSWDSIYDCRGDCSLQQITLQMDGQAILLRENQVGTQTTKSTVWSQSIDENGDKHITQARRPCRSHREPSRQVRLVLAAVL